MGFKHTQLDNGLTVIAEVNPAAASMAAGFFVQTGSRDETPELAGVSHFLEHMVFKGTARRSAQDVNRELDEIGAHYNAATSVEDTFYYGAVLPEYQQRLLDVLCDILRPALRQEDFDVEKGVILEEIAMLEDSPQYRLLEVLMGEHFAGHCLGNSVPGTGASIAALTRQQMQDYFDRRYCPGNLIAVAVGAVDYPAFLSQLTQTSASWPARRTRPRPTDPPAFRPARKVIADPRLTRQQIALMSAAPDHHSRHRFAAQLLSAILGDATGSRLYYALVDPAIADEAATSYEPMDGAGGFLTFLSCDPHRAAQAIDLADAELRKLRDEGPTEAELTAAKNKIACAATLRGELPMGRLTAVGFDWAYRRQYVPLAEQIASLLTVTPKQVQDVARQYDLAAATVVALGPLESL